MTILIVEDDPMVRDINAQFARRVSVVTNVLDAPDVEAAKSVLESQSVDLVLLDVYLPVGRGPEILEWIREKALPTEAIFISADKSKATVERALHLGALDYLVKPFTLERFTAAIEDAHARVQELKAHNEEFDQETLDAVFHRGPEQPEPRTGEVAKGMSKITWDLVLRAVRAATGAFTAQEMSRQLGMSRVTVRRYLDHMEQEGIVEIDLEYGKVGRPQHYYRSLI